MDATFRAVERLERLFGQPLPVAHVVILISEESTCGCTYGFAFDTPLEMQQGTEEMIGGQRLYGHIAHELFHNCIQGSEWWVYDGTVRSFEYIYGVEFGLEPRAYENLRGGCEVHDIKMLTELEDASGSPNYGCTSYLGGELFIELFKHLGTTEYGERMREIHHLSVDRKEQGHGGHIGIDTIRRIFASESEIVEKHWSGKLNDPEKVWKMQMSSESHNLIRWDQNPTYDGDSITFSGTLLGDAVLSGGTIAQALRDGYRNFHLYSVDRFKFMGNINPPGWTHGTRHPGDNTALEYRLEGKTFTVRFRLPEALGNPADYFVDVWGFRDESRTPVIWQDRDRLGYARIIVE